MSEELEDEEGSDSACGTERERAHGRERHMADADTTDPVMELEEGHDIDDHIEDRIAPGRAVEAVSRRRDHEIDDLNDAGQDIGRRKEHHVAHRGADLLEIDIDAVERKRECKGDEEACRHLDLVCREAPARHHGNQGRREHDQEEHHRDQEEQNLARAG